MPLEHLAAARIGFSDVLHDVNVLVGGHAQSSLIPSPADGRGGRAVYFLVFLARSIASVIMVRASAASPNPVTLTHLPGSRSL